MRFFQSSPAGQVAAAMRRIYDLGLTTATGGNISLRENNGDIWITPKGYDKGSLTSEDIVCVHPDGSFKGRHEPSSELPFHKAAYRAQPGFRAVVHAHPVACIAFSLTRTMPRVDLLPDTLVRCRNMRLSKYALTGSIALAENLYTEFAKGADVVFLENHGVCVGAKNMIDAFQLFETIDYAARIDLLTRKLGNPVALTAEQLALLESIPAVIASSKTAHNPDAAEAKLRAEMIEKMRRGCEHALFGGAIGICSARLGRDSFLITPKGLDNALLEEGDIVLVRDGNISHGAVNPVDAALHAQIYAQHPSVNAVISAAPEHAMAFAASGKQLDSYTVPESYMMLRDILRRPFEEPLKSPASVAAKFSAKTPVVLFENYCVVTTGDSLFTAFDRLEVAEATAASIITARDVGDIVLLSQQEIQEMKEALHLE